MDDNNQTSGQPKPEPEECVKEQKITDHFKIMIDKARKAQKLVLIKRADDLLRWGAQEEYDFSKIFGVKGNKEVNIRKYGHNTGRRMNARFLMMDGVRRLMIIANDLTMSSFINYTGCISLYDIYYTTAIPSKKPTNLKFVGFHCIYANDYLFEN